MQHSLVREATRTVAVGAFLLASAGAHANLIANGDFETGDLSGWTTFTTANGSLGTATVVPFDTTGSGPSNAAQFEVGQVIFQPDALAGGGIYQTFSFGGGSIVVDLDIAAQTACACANGSGGLFELLIDGSVVASFDFGFIDQNTIYRSTLSYAGLLASGTHELRVLMERPFQISPYQYVDNVLVSGGTIPEPGSLALLSLGLVGLAASRRRRQ